MFERQIQKQSNVGRGIGQSDRRRGAENELSFI
jgi:hypothetical protein